MLYCFISLNLENLRFGELQRPPNIRLEHCVASGVAEVAEVSVAVVVVKVGTVNQQSIPCSQ